MEHRESNIKMDKKTWLGTMANLTPPPKNIKMAKKKKKKEHMKKVQFQ